MIGRRGFITGLISFVAAPAIVRAGSLMPVKVMEIQTIIGMDFGIGPAYAALVVMSRQFPDEWKMVIDSKAIPRYIQMVRR